MSAELVNPLRWPEGWPRTASHMRRDGSQFRKGDGYEWNGAERKYVGKADVTLGAAKKSLVDELDRLGAKSVVVSSNLSARADGSARGKINEPGVALYFDLKGRPIVMAQDAFDNVASNVRSLALAIECLRGLERHGGGSMMKRAFDGFAALPPPAGAKPKRPWWQVFRYSDNVEDRELLSVSEVEARFRTLAKKLHPDVNPGADVEEMQELNEALAEAKKELDP
jgi:hypothetical protein